MGPNGESVDLLLGKTDDELFELLGEELSRRENRGLPLPKEKLIKNAQQWLTEFLGRSRKIICGNHRVRELSENGEQIVLVGAIADLISHLCVGYPVGLISVLVTRAGVNRLCLEFWRSESPSSTQNGTV
jgi:hypothetical protein